MQSKRFIRPLFITVSLLAAGASSAQSPKPTPPPEPPVKPIVSAPIDVDKNQTRVDDLIETRVLTAGRTLNSRSATTSETLAAKQEMETQIPVELVFRQQITQDQIDAFLKAGGIVDKIFTHVSYGWTGSIPLQSAVELPSLMGPDLLGVVLSQKAELYLDQATRNGRVRPMVWNSGIDGVPSGLGRTTIAILDTGVDGSHTDLTGRMEYWLDTTADALAVPADLGHHGSHVAGIAVGTGAASPSGSTSINYTDIGTMVATPGAFFPSPIHVPTSVNTLSWTSNLRWVTGGGTQAKLGHLVADTSGNYALLSVSSPSASSPITNNTSGFANPPSALYRNRYSTYATKETADSNTPRHTISSSVSYASPGDGYNTFRGVAPLAPWAGYKVFQNNGTGSNLDIEEAIDDLVAKRVTHQIKVANMSLGIIDPSGNSYGISTTLRNKTNTAASNGVIMVTAGGNSGQAGITAARQHSDPARAHYAITVAASSDVNQLTAYSSHGFAAPGDANMGDEDIKPDIIAPGGSTIFQSNIMSIDSNTADSTNNLGTVFRDGVSNDYYNIQGTSMASPFIAGCAALVIEALQQSGESWDFTGAAALQDVLRVKMLLLMTATETNLPRETGPSPNPVLNRGHKDTDEGYGIVNADAAVEATLNLPIDTAPVMLSDNFDLGPYARRCWSRRINLTGGSQAVLNLNVPATGDFDMYIYRGMPDGFGNPQILVNSTLPGTDADEAIVFTPAVTEVGYLVIKRVSGNGTWTLTSPSSVAAWSLY